MKKLTRNKLRLRNTLRTFGMIFSIIFIFEIFAVISLFVVEVLEGDLDIFYFVSFLGFLFTFINILPDDYLMTYKRYLKSLEKKK